MFDGGRRLSWPGSARAPRPTGPRAIGGLPVCAEDGPPTPEPRDRLHPPRRSVHAVHAHELASPPLAEDLGPADPDLHQRHEAVGGEGRDEDGELLHAPGAELGQDVLGVGRESLLEAEAQSERHGERGRREAIGFSSVSPRKIACGSTSSLTFAMTLATAAAFETVMR